MIAVEVAADAALGGTDNFEIDRQVLAQICCQGRRSGSGLVAASDVAVRGVGRSNR